MLVFMALYSHIYLYMHNFVAQEVQETYSQCIHTQEAGVHYTQLTQLRCSATQLPC